MFGKSTIKMAPFMRFSCCFLQLHLIGIFITSNFIFVYLNWEFMLIPPYLIIGYWGYNKPFKSAFKFFVFTQTGAIFILIGIVAVYFYTNSIDMFIRSRIINWQSDAPGSLWNGFYWLLLKWFCRQNGHFSCCYIWFPDCHASDAPAPMSSFY